MSTGGPDLFVICKNCQSEVSPYITECPYCGSRLRKRAPKLDRDGRVSERKRRSPTPSLPRLRPWRDPRDPSRVASVRDDRAGPGRIRRHAAVARGARREHPRDRAVGAVRHASVVAAAGGPVHLRQHRLRDRGAWHDRGVRMAARAPPRPRCSCSPLFAIASVGGAAVTAADSSLPLALGGNGGALALLIAWAIPDLLSLRAGEDIDGDLLGTAVIAVVVLLMPLAAPGRELDLRGDRRADRDPGRAAAGADRRTLTSGGGPARRRMINNARGRPRLHRRRAGGCDRSDHRSRATARGAGHWSRARRRRSSGCSPPRSTRADGSTSDTTRQFRRRPGTTTTRERVRAVQTMLAEETRLGMLVGVAVGFELARELAREPGAGSQTTLED